MIRQSLVCQILLLGTLILAPLPARAISTLSIIPAGKGIFLLSGADLENLARIDVVVAYDTTCLVNPHVARESLIEAAKLGVDNGSPGVVRLIVTAAVPLKGNGAMATLTFDHIADSVGMITGLNGKVFDLNNVSLPVIFSITNPPPPPDPQDDPPAQPDGTPQPSAQGSSASATANPSGVTVWQGGVRMPDEEKNPVVRSDEPTVPEPQRDTSAAAGEAPPPEAVASPVKRETVRSTEPSVPEVQSVLERFRRFQGECTAGNLAALFDPRGTGFFRQEPPIALADGVQTVSVTISGVSGSKAPNFALTSARYVSCRRAGEGEWSIVVQPERGALSAGITLITDGAVRTVPLTVSPGARVDLIKPGTVSPADFALFLKERGTAGAPRFDLNGDGKRDYQDDYIFTANYLLARERAAHRKTPATTTVSVPAAESVSTITMH